MKQLFTIVILAAMAGTVHAKISRVNNNATIDADFHDLQKAIYASASGDTLYVEGSTIGYSNQNGSDYTYIVKPIVIFGPGYFLSENENTLAKKISATVSSKFVIYPEAKKTIIQGMRFDEVVYLGASDCEFSRNYTSQTLYLGYYKDSLGSNSLNYHSISSTGYIISQCYLNSGISCYYSDITSSIICNNIIPAGLTFQQNDQFEITNNTLTSNIEVYNSTIKNNISYGSILEGRGNTVLYNVASISGRESQYFIMGSIPDKKFMMTTASPARTAGVDGSECGAFGGSNPYVLSGLPPIPHIYELNVPTSGSDNSGLKVTVKVKAQN